MRMFNNLRPGKKIEALEKSGQDDNRSLEKAVEGSSTSGQRREASPSELVTREKDKNEKKKKPKHSEDIEGSFVGSLANETRGGAVSSGGGSSNPTGGASGSHKSQTAGLSVNDFITKTKNQQRQGLKPSGPELIAYARYLGIDPVADHDLLWVAEEALEAPLPSDWTEHKDSNDRVFYYNATMRVSSWTHPLEHVYRETYKTIVTFRNANMSLPERTQKISTLRGEVEQMEKDVNKEIAQWTQHEDEHKNKFYFNRELRQSTWTDPRPAKCQILYLRMKMLHLLSSSIVGTAGISDNKCDFDRGSRFAQHPIAGKPTEMEQPKAVAKTTTKISDEPLVTSAAHDSSPPASLGSSDSETDEDKRSKKKKKKKKEKREKKSSKEANHSTDDSKNMAAPPPRLGSKMRSSQSEPTLGGKPSLSNVDDTRGGLGGLQSSPSMPSMDHTSPALSTAGHARPKAGIRLDPIAPKGL